MKTLIVGCSYCTTLNDLQDTTWTLGPNYKIAATAGTGNPAIAARVVYECSEEHYDRVIVLWSGVNRVDCTIPVDLHETYPGAKEHRPEYSFCTPTGDIVWYHSGGMVGSWQTDNRCPREIRDWFKVQYLGASKRYLSDTTLLAVSATQKFLQSQGIDYQMGWIYNIYQDYSTKQFEKDNSSERRYEHFFGQVDIKTGYMKLVDWSKVNTTCPVYEWVTENNLPFENDQFHPTRTSMKQWFLDVLGVDLTQ